MSLSFQIALLGPEHTYVASITKILSSTCPLKVPEKEFFRIPQKFQDDFNNLASAKNYMYNIRGHDFLSHSGQCTNKNVQVTALQQSAVIWAETDELRKVAVLDAQRFGGISPELTASFGPAPGSFFADAPRLRRYEWANLPRKLEVSLKELICLSGYGDKKTKIRNVAINSRGGWVLLGGRDNLVQWGGVLPATLENVLKTLGRRRPHIETLVMNHQHPTEYVLVLDDGQVYCRLHSEFEKQLQPMLDKWAKSKNVDLRWKFESSCDCPQEVQKLQDALYYHRRGWFFLQRGFESGQQRNFERAYEYLQEAHTQNPGNESIQIAYARSLLALRPCRNDPVLETYLAKGDLTRQPPAGTDSNVQFRHQYWLMWKTIDMVRAERLEHPTSPTEWSLEQEEQVGKEGIRKAFELESPVQEGMMELAAAQRRVAYG